jgi:hypothetical protein
MFLKAVAHKNKKWEDNIKMDVREILCVDWKWMQLSEGHAQWVALALVIVNFHAVLLES